MISQMVVAIPAQEVDRGWFGKQKNADFIKTTGIAHTWRWEGSTLDLAVQAVKRLDRRSFGAVIFVTQSPDQTCPSMACELAERLGVDPYAPLFDVNQACSGFVYGLWLARQIQHFPVLLVVADRLRVIYTDPEANKYIFSDGAAAAVVEASETVYPTSFLNDTTGVKKLRALSREGLMTMDGGAVFDFVTRKVPPLVRSYQTWTECDLLVQHQSNLAMMNWIDKKSGFENRGLYSIEELGNLSMASIPAAIAANENQALGKSLLLCGYGAGWSAAATRVDWPSQPITKLVRC